MATKANNTSSGKSSGKSASSKTASAKSGSGKSASAKGTSSAKKNTQPEQRSFNREIWAAVCFFVGFIALIGYFNVDAVLITYFRATLKGFIGYGYWLLPPALLVCAVILAFHKGRPVRLRSICLVCVPVVFGALVHALFCRTEFDFSAPIQLIKDLYSTGSGMSSGGLISGLLGEGLERLLSIWVTAPLFIVVILVLLMISFKVTPQMVAEKAKSGKKARAEYEDGEEEPDPIADAKPDNSAHKLTEERTQTKPKRGARAIDIPLDDDVPSEDYEEKKVGFFNTNPRVKTPAKVFGGDADTSVPVAEKKDPTADVKPLSIEEAASIAGVVPVEIKTQEVSSAPVQPAQPEQPKAAAKPVSKRAATETEIRMETDQVARAIEEKNAEDHGEYHYPPLALLNAPDGTAADGREEMAINSKRLQATLDSFGVNARIVDVTRGPTVTRYDLELEAGVKLAKITNLAGDLALALGVSGVRIAPIPDMISTVGVEVPNKIVSTVYLSEILESDNFRNAPSKLTFAIGKDIGGNCICGNIAKLPHMLIAGTTGSGKSVCMNSLILSLLYKATPEEVRLIMIDPKMVELGIYNGIPHLYIPVVTDPKKAAGALQWSVVEMLKRYRLFSEAGVRDLAGYNAVQKRNGESILPQVVIIIDELADLMMVASKEVEESICRVAQMGRASGMHLIIATQRPSADVITGTMKANIPSRIAMSVASAMESRIIMDQGGAEKLVGNGDMLFSPVGGGKARRIQGAFVSDEEREDIVNFVKRYGQAEYSDEIMAAVEKAAVEAKGSSSGASARGEDEPAAEKSQYDELLPQAADVIFETKQASVSMLQRRLKLGYSRAARIVDQMEEMGILGPFEGSKPRQILITKEQWQEMQMLNGTAPAEQLQMDIFEEAEEDGFDEEADWESEE